MAGQFECENCGAILLEEDLFCGECGAPRSSLPEAPDSAVEQPVAVDLPVVEPAPYVPPRTPRDPPRRVSPSGSPGTGWRVAVIILVVLGVIACLVALISFFAFGSMESEYTTVTEDWLFSAGCCLLPIGGVGAILLTVGTVLWYTRVRKR